ncbi:gliding motility-associated C-terminal domain-containing protein, partial [Bacillus pumilus]|uniref:gliding motility-associated C-terminal domain-containing protein n=1 Tax=Bacillus pumilus TaxID=1408 RepID=UPI0033161141
LISNDEDVQIKALQTAQYFLTVTSQLGCGSSVDGVKVEVYDDIYIPNAFTPNNDGKNDVWNIPTLNSIKEFELIVYNRRGSIVHRQQNQFQPWDGKLNQQLVEKGVYVYTLYIRSNQKKYTGTLTIL